MLFFGKKLWIFVKERIPSYFFFLELSCSRVREPWQHAQIFLTSPHFKLLLSIVPYPPSKNDYFSSLFATTKYPTLYCIFFRKSKNQKKHNKKVRRAIKMNDALTIKLCTSKKTKKQKLYFGQLPQHLTTSWLHEKKSDSQMSHFRSLFFSSLCKSFTQSDSSKQNKKDKTHFASSSYWVNV